MPLPIPQGFEKGCAKGGADNVTHYQTFQLKEGDSDGIHQPLIGNNESTNRPSTECLNEHEEDISYVRSEPLTYQRRGGTDGTHGQLYEVQLYMLFLARASIKTDNLQIATNVGEIGAFDDVVVKYCHANEKKSKTAFMQVKHKLNIDERGKYNLKNKFTKDLLGALLESYITIKNTFSSRNDGIYAGDFADCEFILYTNNLLHSNTKCKASNFQDISKDMEQMLSTKGHIVQLHEHQYAEVHKLFEKKEKQVVDEFLDHFHLFIGQDNQKELKETIKKEIGKAFNVDKTISGFTYKSLYKEAFKLRNQIGDCQAHTEYTAKHLVLNLILDHIGKPEKNPSYDCIRIGDEKIVQLAGLVMKHRVVNIVDNQNKFKLLSIIGIRQLLEKKPDMRPLFLELKQFIQYESLVLQAFQMRNLLVIAGNCSSGHINVLGNIYSAMQANTNMRVIFVTDDTAGGILQMVFEDIVYDKITFCDLDCETKEKLGQKELFFQGKRIPMCQLIDIRDKDAADLVDSETIMKLIKNKLVICKAPQGLRDLETEFGQMRTEISLENLVDASKTLKDESLFLIFGITENILRSKCRGSPEINEMLRKGIIQIFPVRSNHDDMLDTFRKKCVKEIRIVYLIDFHDQKFTLQHLYDPKSYVRRHFYRSGSSRIWKDVLFQEMLNCTFILECNSGQIDAKKWGQDWKENCLRIFEQKCDNGSIIFECDGRAQIMFKDLCERSNSVIWLFVGFGDFIEQGCNDPLLRLNVQGKYDEEYIFNVLRCDATCIVSPLNRKTVTQLFISHINKKIQFFLSNYENKAIVIKTPRENDKFSPLEFSKNNKPMHRLRIDANDIHTLVWLYSNCSLKAFDGYVSTRVDESVFDNFHDKCVILADDPGMGKSTTFKRLAGEKLCTNWVIFVNLKECNVAIESLPSPTDDKDITLDEVANFFTKVKSAGIESNMQSQLFAHNARKSNLQTPLIFLDAFDEVDVKYHEKLIYLLKFLMEQSLATVFVSTRFSKAPELETALDIIATRFAEFNAIQQEEFINRFWLARLSMSFPKARLDETLQKYVNGLLSKSTKLLGGQILNSVGVPLQLQMLAEVFQSDAVKYCESDIESKINSKGLKIVDLYERFVDGRYNIHLKGNIDSANFSAEIAVLKKHYNQQHQHLAVDVVFPQENELNMKPMEFSKNDKRTLQRIGIIQSFGSKTNIYFIHFTFAEYFLADLFVGNLKESATSTRREKTIQFLNRCIFDKTNYIIAHFIDQMLSRDSPTHRAALEGDLKQLLTCLKQKQGKPFVDSLGRTALHLAARDGRETIIKVLLHDGYNAFDQDFFGKTCLHYTAMKGDECVAEYLLNYTSDNDIASALPTKVGPTACDPNRKCIFVNSQSLSSNIEAFVNKEDASGDSSLRIALRRQFWGIACMLIKFGADMSCMSKKEHKAMLDFTKRNGIRFKAVKLILRINEGQQKSDDGDDKYKDKDDYDCRYRRKDDYDCRYKRNDDYDCRYKRKDDYDDGDETNEDKYTQQQLFRAAERHDFKEVKRLVGTGAKVHVRNFLGYTALDYALIYDRHKSTNMEEIVNTVKYLCHDCQSTSILNAEQLRLVMDIMDNGNPVLLHKAATLSGTVPAAYLIHRGANVNATDQHGRTPLHHAAIDYRKFKGPNEATQMVRFLIENGGIHNVKDIDNRTVSDCLRDERDGQISRLIGDIDKVFNDPGMAISVQRNLSTVMQHYSTRNNETLLHFAITRKDRKLLSHLLTCIDRCQFNKTDQNGNTPLHYASSLGCNEEATLLLRFGADFNPVNNNGETPKQIAENTNLEIWKNLQTIHNIFDVITTNITDDIKASLNFIQNENRDFFLIAINSHDNEGNTPLHLAAKSNNFEIVRFLLTVGAGYDAVNEKRETFDKLANDEQIKDLFQVVHSVLDSVYEKIDYKAITEQLGPHFANARNRNWQTFLHKAGYGIFYKNFYRINYFIDNGADINSIDRKGRTILDEAIPCNLDFVKHLLMKGINVSNLTTDKLKELKDGAESQGRDDILAMLVEFLAPVD